MKKSSTKNVRSSSRSSKNRVSKRSIWVSIIFLLTLIFIPGVAKVYLAAQTERYVRLTSDKKREINDLNLEIKNLKIKKEQLSSWVYIDRKIRQYNLNLKGANPIFVRELNRNEGVHWAIIRKREVTQADRYKRSNY